jgi:hypothetical protein
VIFFLLVCQGAAKLAIIIFVKGNDPWVLLVSEEGRLNHLTLLVLVLDLIQARPQCIGVKVLFERITFSLSVLPTSILPLGLERSGRGRH